jgi:hypothetical protein
VNRRDTLQGAGPALLALVAGCNALGGDSGTDGVPGTDGVDGETDSTPTPTTSPRVEVSMDVPSSVRVGQPFSPALTVENAGDATGDLDATLVARTEGERVTSTPARYLDLSPGERDSFEVGPLVLDSRGEYVLTVTGTDARAVISPEPRRLPAGESTVVRPGLRATVREVTFEWSMPTTFDAGFVAGQVAGAAAAPEGSVLGLAALTVENTRDESLTVDRDWLVPEAGSVPTTLGDLRPSGPELDDVGIDDESVLLGDVFGPTLSLAPGERAERRLLCLFDRSSAADGVGLGVDRGGPGRLPETVFEASVPGETAFPSVELVELSVPSLSRDPTGTLSFTVENTGLAEATVRCALQYRADDGWRNETLATPRRFETTLSLGERHTFEATWQGCDPVPGTYTYRITPFDREFEVTYGD